MLALAGRARYLTFAHAESHTSHTSRSCPVYTRNDSGGLNSLDPISRPLTHASTAARASLATSYLDLSSSCSSSPLLRNPPFDFYSFICSSVLDVLPLNIFRVNALVMSQVFFVCCIGICARLCLLFYFFFFFFFRVLDEKICQRQIRNGFVKQVRGKKYIFFARMSEATCTTALSFEIR